VAETEHLGNVCKCLLCYLESGALSSGYGQRKCIMVPSLRSTNQATASSAYPHHLHALQLLTLLQGLGPQRNHLWQARTDHSTRSARRLAVRSINGQHDIHHQEAQDTLHQWSTPPVVSNQHHMCTQARATLSNSMSLPFPP
jgi:hypothetical protein